VLCVYRFDDLDDPLVVLGCRTDPPPFEVQKPGDEATPDIEVSPEEVAFGSADVGEGEALVEVVTVRNVGEANLHVSDLYIADEGGPFIVGEISASIVDPDGETDFTVTFAPEVSGIATGVHYSPGLHQHPAYARFAARPLPVKRPKA